MVFLHNFGCKLGAFYINLLDGIQRDGNDHKKMGLKCSLYLSPARELLGPDL